MEPLVQIASFTNIYIGIRYLFSNEKNAVESLFHASIAIYLTGSTLIKYTSFHSLFTHHALFDIEKYLTNNTESYKDLHFAMFHSLGYFLGDTIYSLSIGNYTYFWHHFFTILGILPVFADSHLFYYGIFLGELGALSHHGKTYEKVIQNKYLKLFATIQYYLFYTFSRYLMLSNMIHFSFSTSKYVDYIQILLGCPVIIQNCFWIMKNIKNQKIICRK